jgi:hypothetical protein
VTSTQEDSRSKSLAGRVQGSRIGFVRLFWLTLLVLLCGFPAQAQSQPRPVVLGANNDLPNAPRTWQSPAQQSPGQQSSGTITGTLIDRTGTAIAGARVKLTRDDQSSSQEVLSSEDGQFAFANIAPGPFHLSITSTGFAAQEFSGNLRSGEAYRVPPISLALATAITEVRVVPSPVEMAEEQIKDQEKQRVLGVLPNFYVTYIPNAVPLTPKQKFQLAWKTTVDPVTFGVTGAIAGIQQAQNDFSGYGQGAQGYGKRYAASYADGVIGTFIGSAILPSLLKQDPRYFYKGTGSKRSRILYALANSVICKGDNGRWQPSYSAILGSFAAGAISNLYYPANDRDAALTVQNSLIGIGANAATNLLQEFVIRRLTPNTANSANSANPANSAPANP